MIVHTLHDVYDLGRTVTDWVGISGADKSV